MTKELELFKRWFGWDPSDSLALLYTEGKNKGFWICPMDSIFTIYTSMISYYDLENIFNKYLMSIYGTDPYIGTAVCYRIPPEYHAEWEQYVKEKS
jgi:hypothetical protein